MTSTSRRSGSALIIVLGFLSFMVVSAVAFAVYMRTERVASSGFHRTASVRQMVKAGMANAIAQIDAAVGNDPFPGLPVYPGSGGDFGLDHWKNCVFMPYKVAPESATVPVLPLEGLAYLPPALVNEVRATARNTYSAQWQNLDYDIGRFAYVAVNVSDFFDVNKLRFGSPRSTGPSGRVSLAYLFQNDQGTRFANDASASKLQALDKFLDSRGGGADSQVPFVSLADLNVALFKADGNGTKLGVYSPFFSYLKTGKSRAFYSQSGVEEDTLVARAGRMLFVTDSWQHPTNKVDSVIDLSRDEDQPFRKSAFAENKTFATLLQSVGRAYSERLVDELSVTSIANLYDYLDDNSVPLSLGIPNVERTPMIGVVNGTMISESLQFTLKGETKEENYNKGGQGQGQTYVKKTTTYKLEPKVTGNAMVNVVCMYPFKGKTKREGEKSSKSYKVQVIAKVFFTKPGQNAGGGWSGRCQQATKITPTKSEWDGEGVARVDNNCITLVSRKTAMGNFPSEVFEDKDAVFDTIVTLPSVTALNADLATKFLLETQRLYRKSDMGSEVEVTDMDGFPKATTFKLLPFASDLPKSEGAQIVKPGEAGDAENEVPLETAKCWGMTLTPHIALWARVIDDNNKTVDLAPASMYEDDINGGAAAAIARAFITIAGDGCPYTPMLAASGKPIVFSKETHKVAFEGDQETIAPFGGTAAAFAALDPRFNHSPEDFIARSSGLTKEGYIQEVRKLLGVEGRDPDIFMFASDQEYLQSIGELAFLPKIGELGETQNGLYARCTTPLAFRESFEALDAKYCHRNSFWRTYPLYRQKDDGYGDEDYLFRYFSSEIEAGDKVIVSDVNGYKVSPYSELEKIRLAVTANTPHSFWASSTNTVLTKNPPPCFSGPGQPKSMDECLKYCFNEMTGNVGPQLAWKDVTNITEYVFTQMRVDALARKDWEDSFASMEWYPDRNDPGRIFNYTLGDNSDDLHSVDRKMLYSFWHDSMANRQQLFLVFVRVEAIPLGASDSAISDTLPPQYGGRAVALVWRDPAASPSARKVQWRNQEGGSDLFGCSLGSGSTYAPHRTRLLFYHQFD